MLRAYLNLPSQVHLLCLGTVVNRAGTLLLPFLAVYAQRRLHLGPQFCAQLVGTFGLGSMAAQLWGGHLADTLGRKPVMLGALAGSASMMLVFGYATTPGQLMGATFALAAVGDTYRPAAAALLADLTQPQDRRAAYGLNYAAVNLGFGVAPILGGLLAQRSMEALLAVDASTSLLFAALIALAVKETRVTLLGDSPPPHVAWRAAMAAIARDAPFLQLCGASVVLGAVFAQHLSTLPIHVASLGIALEIYGKVLALNGIMIVVLQLPITGVTHAWTPKRALAVACVLCGMGFALTAWVQSPWSLAGSVAVWTLGEIVAASHHQAWAASLAPLPLRARYMGVFSLTFALGNTLGSPLGGWVLEHVGPGALWGGCGATGVCAAALFLSIPAVAQRPGSAASPGANAA